MDRLTLDPHLSNWLARGIAHIVCGLGTPRIQTPHYEWKRTVAVRSSPHFVEFEGTETGCTVRYLLSFSDWAWIVIFGQTESGLEDTPKDQGNKWFWGIYAMLGVIGASVMYTQGFG